MTILQNVEVKNIARKRFKTYSQNMCTTKTLKKRLPIAQWLPTYTYNILIEDFIAGVTVGLAAIPQGMAYAVIAGLSPEYGLYAGIMGGFVYLFFGGCKDVSVGPTAIMSALVARYISGYSADFAVLAAFLAGITELALGILNLGFLVQFISKPVLCGFTTAAAFQISMSQFKSLFGLAGLSGNYFADSFVNFVRNIKTAKIWDSALGLSTIVMLMLLKQLGHGCTRTDNLAKQIKFYVSISRNAIVVLIGILIAYLVKVTTATESLTVIGEIPSGLPTFQLPPFSTLVGNTTYSFIDMVQTLGPQSLVLPLVSILEIVAIGSAFSGGVPIDASQEMIALGLCNIMGSFVSGMPVTGSFSRAALNNDSGAQTPAGGIVTACLVALAISVMTSVFYFIPKSTLAGLIIAAMISMTELTIFVKLWRNSKRELTVSLITISFCLFYGLEFGILIGIAVDAVLLLLSSSKPYVDVSVVSGEKGEVLIVLLSDRLSYCSADYVWRAILNAARRHDKKSTLIIDGTNLRSIDTTVTFKILSVVKDLEKKSISVVFLNFGSEVKNFFYNISPESQGKFMIATDSMELISKLSIPCVVY